MPLAIHVHHLDDMFLIYSDEYDESQKILDEIAKILNVEVTDLRLYFSNKRRVELDTVNHDQQIIHNCHLYLTMKKEDQWENVKDIIGYNIYDVNLDQILEKEEEERKKEELKNEIIITKEEKKKEKNEKNKNEEDEGNEEEEEEDDEEGEEEEDEEMEIVDKIIEKLLSVKG